MQNLISDEDYKAYALWLTLGKDPIQSSERRADMARIVAGMYFEGLATFREMQEALDAMYGKLAR